MAFLLIHIDHKPLFIKGQPMVTGIAVTNDGSPLLKGEYYGVNSKINIMVLNSGGIARSTPEARSAFSVCKPIPVAVDLNVNLIQNELDEVFVLNNSEKILQLKSSITPLLKDIENFWIPIYFSDENQKIAEGWVKQQNKGLDIRMVYSQPNLIPETVQVTLLHNSTVQFYLNTKPNE